MADAEKPMHQDFSRWYSAVSVGGETERCQARWKGLLSVVSGAERSTVEALVRLAYSSRAAASTAEVEKIRHAFREVDNSFDMSGNDRELQVLAGSCLAVLMEDLTEEEGAAAALAVTTAAFGGARKPNLPMDLAALGEAAIDRRSGANRKRPSLSDQSPSEAPKLDFEKAVVKIRENPNFDGVIEAFGLASESVRNGMTQLARRQARAMQAAETFIHVQDEELQILWWLIGQRSEGYDCAFEAVPIDARPFVFASELANATQFLPGPASAKAILSRAGLKERKKISVTLAVNAPRADWLNELMVDIDPSPVSTPLHYGIKRQLETGQGQAWVAGWAASSGIDAEYALPSLTLGELFYRERLLVLLG